MSLKSVGFFSCAQVQSQNSKMKADWFTIIKKSASNDQKNENEGANVFMRLPWEDLLAHLLRLIVSRDQRKEL